jgi:hypothetical protein
LQTAEHALEEKERTIQLKSIALGEVVDQIEAEKRILKETIAANISDCILPIIAKLRLTDPPAEMLDLLDRTLEEITDRFNIRVSQAALNLSPRESEIIRLIHRGLTSKRYCQLLWTENSERSLAHPFSGGYQNTNPFEIVRCRATTEVVFPPFPNDRMFFGETRSGQSRQAAS